MTTFKDFESYNAYVGLPEPQDNNIDIGYYDDKKIRLQSDTVIIDFYRVSIKSNFIDKTAPDYNPGNPNSLTGVFFNSPE